MRGTCWTESESSVPVGSFLPWFLEGCQPLTHGGVAWVDGGGEREPCIFEVWRKGSERDLKFSDASLLLSTPKCPWGHVGPQPSIRGESSSAFFVPCIRSCRTNSLRWQNALMQELGVPIKGHVKKWLKQEHVSDWLALLILRNPPCFWRFTTRFWDWNLCPTTGYPPKIHPWFFCSNLIKTAMNDWHAVFLTPSWNVSWQW